jgi:hypothetical protein
MTSKELAGSLSMFLTSKNNLTQNNTSENKTSTISPVAIMFIRLEHRVFIGLPPKGLPTKMCATRV